MHNLQNLQNTFKLCLLSLSWILTFVSCAESRDIYVRLSDRPSSAALTSEGAMTLVDAGGKSHGLGKSAVLTRSGASAVVGKHKYPLPVYISSPKLLGFNGRKYRGKFFLTKEFVLINVLDVEDYIRGVLPAEASSNWPKEYLKVQAIISRTYGLRQSLNRSARGYDVVDNTSDQVYKGAGVETSAANQAIKETEGKVLAYKDALAFTPFHSDSGGHTATNAHVWGKDVPYLKGVREPVSYSSPNASWTAKIPASQVQAALSKMGSGVGRIQEIRVAETDSAGRAINLTFVGSNGSSSVKSSLFRTTIGPNLLKSTMLTAGTPEAKGHEDETPETKPDVLKPKRPLDVSEESGPLFNKTLLTDAPILESEEVQLMRMTSDGVFTSAELMDMLLNPDKRKDYLNVGIQRGNEEKDVPKSSAQKSSANKSSSKSSSRSSSRSASKSSKKSSSDNKSSSRAALPKSLPEMSMPALRSRDVIREENGFFVFRGKGWGHGVGLSQWGAQALAKKGWSAERILEHYYPGTAVKRFK
ncbi:MAG: SpoIID/LytB domain-containing protein [Synergistaceae bacterium]|nr:SpoIID/LytB domain-containing protein [Synergistaceae bacterium]